MKETFNFEEYEIQVWKQILVDQNKAMKALVEKLDHHYKETTQKNR